jgi:hypothetical protein
VTSFVPENQHPQQSTECTAKNCRQKQSFFRNTPVAANGFDLIKEVKQGHGNI